MMRLRRHKTFENSAEIEADSGYVFVVIVNVCITTLTMPPPGSSRRRPRPHHPLL